MNTEVIKTSDYVLVGLLRYFGISPSATEDSYGKIIFCFDKAPQTAEICEKFEFGKEILIDVSKLFSITKEVRGSIMRKKYQ